LQLTAAILSFELRRPTESVTPSAIEECRSSTPKKAARTGTPLAVFKNGEVVRIQVTQDMLKPVTPKEQ
jgi:hypothetical protein